MNRMYLATAIGVAALLSGLAPAWADMSGSGAEPKDNTPASQAMEDKRVDQIYLKTDSNVLVKQVVVMTPDCSFRGATDRSMRRNINKLGFTQDLPLIGGLFEQTPRRGDLNDSNQLGLAYLKDGTLFVDLRPPARAGAPDPGLLSALADGPAGSESQTFAVAAGAPALQSFSIVNRDFEYLVRLGNFSPLAPAGRHCGANASAGPFPPCPLPKPELQ